MQYFQDQYPVTKAAEIAEGIYDFTVRCPGLAKAARPGTFVHIRVPGFTLRRPISICEITEDSIRLVFEVRGEGTAVLANVKEGDLLDVMGPLGNGFTLSDTDRVIVIGGGIGAPPMLGTARAYGERATAILGFRDESRVILTEDFENTCRTVLMTDNGTAGRKGFVTEPLAELLKEGKYDRVMACGPKVMLRRVADIAAKAGVPCEVSLEERMGCGIGACLVCACRVKRQDGEGYAHVCKDGPVFPAESVVFDD